MIDTLLSEVQAAYPDRDVALTLTEDGVAAVQAVGTAWLVAAVRALEVAYPGRGYELTLKVDGNEPMPAGVRLDPATAGALFAGQGGAGRLSLSAPHRHRGAKTTADPVSRVLQVPRAELLQAEGDLHFIAPTDPVRRLAGRLYSRLYRRAPVALDTWRQSRNNTAPAARSPMVPKAQALRGARTAPATRGRAGTAGGTTRRPAVWVAMHWLESGGAESWAFRSAEIARDTGLEVVITVDRSAPQRALAKALAITPYVYLAANTLDEEDWGPFLHGLLAAHDVRHVHIHHSARAYGFLPELRHLAPRAAVMDSVHIVEHRTGGFVRQSLELSHLIDVHHVISPALRDLYLLDARVAPGKVAYRPLTDLAGVGAAADGAQGGEPVLAESTARGEGPLRVGFLGRLAPQKRPFLFVELARRLHKAHPGSFSFLMQGSGALGGFVDEQIARAGLGGVIERREWGPAEQFFADVDVLVVSSDNEGLTLTTLEADQHDVLVLSADVGSQRSVIPPLMLVPRAPRGFLTGARRALERLAVDRGARARVRADQRRLLQGLCATEPAGQYLTTYYAPEKEQA
ncbi:glycosyltransferase [Georgenia thermotolerans]|uniref:Glycosyltransferase n=1 Tax=Georgenia thermotolerans TaxID=527326 RepID=A0A7J5UQG6_9MICO|nr:glycosyltransferase [Georgenia thermotolerans]KAE8764547.1 glycosyltransferase [Georgenia thermotolerans]